MPLLFLMWPAFIWFPAITFTAAIDDILEHM